jgi:hypothetical protein
VEGDLLVISRKFNARVLQSEGERVSTPIKAELTWDGENDPYAVLMILSQDGDEVAWHFSRELLNDGLSARTPVGGGDVKVKSNGVLVLVCLKSPEGHADIGLPRADVYAFLQQTFEKVPIGFEKCDDQLDEAIRDILEDAA